METYDDGEELVELRKVPIEGFIAILQDLWEKGADYVDIVGKPFQIQDVMSLVVRKEYVNPEYNGFTEEDDMSLNINKGDQSLNSMNLNDLVG